MNRSFKRLVPTLANAMLYLTGQLRPPQWLFKWVMERAEPFHQGGKLYPGLHRVLRPLWLLRRAFDHLRFMDFSNIPGRGGYVLYRLGIVDFWHRHLSPSATLRRQRTALDLPIRATVGLTAEPRSSSVRTGG